MILSCSTNTFGRHTLAEAIKNIADIGYEGVEILADAPHAYPPVFTPTHPSPLEGEGKGGGLPFLSGLKVVNINANTARGVYGERHPAWAEESVFGPSLSDPRAEVRGERVQYTIQCLQLAHEVKSPSLCLTSGRPSTGCPPEEAIKWFFDSLDRVLKEAERVKVRIGIEYEPGLLLENAEEVQSVLKRYRSPWLGVNFDVGHAVVCGESPEEVIKALGRDIVHVHVEDIVGRKHFHRIPGEGEIDFSAMIAALQDVGYQGALTVELYPYAHDPVPAATKAFRFLSNLMREPVHG